MLKTELDDIEMSWEYHYQSQQNRIFQKISSSGIIKMWAMIGVIFKSQSTELW